MSARFRSSPRSTRSTRRSTAARCSPRCCISPRSRSPSRRSRGSPCAGSGEPWATKLQACFPPPGCAVSARPACCAGWCARPSCRPRTSSTRCSCATGSTGASPIASMPGVDHLSIGAAVEEAGEAAALGIPAVLLFGLPAAKDEEGSGAWDDEGVVQLATRAIKAAHPDLLVITDLCLCEYTSHGHCGVLRDDGVVDNDLTLELLARTAVSPGGGRRRRDRAERHDGRAGRRAARRARRARPRRDADHGLLGEVRVRVLRPVPRGRRVGAARGDRRGYQMDPANALEARARGAARRRRGRRRRHGQAGAAVPRRDPRASRTPRSSRSPPTT